MLALLYITGCGYDDFGDLMPESGGTVVPNTTIGFVRSLCGDGVYNVSDDIVIGGYVTANDRSGNIYRSFFIEDATGAAEIRAGMYSLHNIYTVGRYVSIRLQGLAVTLDNGVFRVGIPPSQGYTGVEYLDSWAVAASYIYPAAEYGGVLPMKLSVPQLAPEYCGRLVTLEYMKLVPEDDPDEEEGGEGTRNGFVEEGRMTWAYPRTEENAVPQAAYRYFEDLAGNRIAVYTSGYATFAGREVPTALLSLTGILSYGNADGRQMYIIRLREAEDAALQVSE